MRPPAPFPLGQRPPLSFALLIHSPLEASEGTGEVREGRPGGELSCPLSPAEMTRRGSQDRPREAWSQEAGESISHAAGLVSSCSRTRGSQTPVRSQNGTPRNKGPEGRKGVSKVAEGPEPKRDLVDPSGCIVQGPAPKGSGRSLGSGPAQPRLQFLHHAGVRKAKPADGDRLWALLSPCLQPPSPAQPSPALLCLPMSQGPSPGRQRGPFRPWGACLSGFLWLEKSWLRS